MHMCMHVCVCCACYMSSGALRRKHWITWSWSFWQLVVSKAVRVWDENLDPLEEQSLFFTAESSL